MSAHDDFGFTMVDDPGESDKNLAARLSDETSRRHKEKQKINEIMRIVNPLLDRLLSDADKPYIKWANRADKIKEIQQKLDLIVERV